MTASDYYNNAQNNNNTTKFDSRRVTFRTVRPTDIEQCYRIEQSSYPDDEAASKSTLQYRQHHAARYFRCAVWHDAHTSNGSSNENDTHEEDEEEEEETGDATATTSISNNNNNNNTSMHVVDDDHAMIIGFVCATRCSDFTASSLQSHEPSGSLLAVHSVVVAEPFRRQGIATNMLKDYIQVVEQENLQRADYCMMDKIVLLAKRERLPFYIQCGFAALRKSEIQHGKELWYHLERDFPKQEQIVLSDALLKRQAFLVDAFCDPQQASGTNGNPAVVVLLPDDAELNSAQQLDWMQSVAAEFNLSETAFVTTYTELNAVDNGDNTTVTTNETAKGRHYSIRFFSPICQIALCGHATLASAAVLYQQQQQQQAITRRTSNQYHHDRHVPIYFHTSENVIIKTEYLPSIPLSPPSRVTSSNEETANHHHRSSSNSNSHHVYDAQQQQLQPSHVAAATTALSQRHSKIKMTVPMYKPLEIEDEDSIREITKMLEMALDIRDCIISFIGFSDLGDVMVEISYEAFLQIGYDADAIINETAFFLYDGYTRGVIVCCQAPEPSSSSSASFLLGDDETTMMDKSNNTATSLTDANTHVDFYSRFFAPKAGIREDPVTGSAHATLAPYYCDKLGKDKVTGRQMSKRGGLIECRRRRADGEDGSPMNLVELSGWAVTVLDGSLWM
jgi:predicted PhzF superfamily epimerase YddE/YHI9/GNAT superfamily N-acetyltransferase